METVSETLFLWSRTCTLYNTATVGLSKGDHYPFTWQSVVQITTTVTNCHDEVVCDLFELPDKL